MQAIDKIKAALTESEFAIFNKVMNNYKELLILVNDELNRKTASDFKSITGADAPVKLLEEHEWQRRAEIILEVEE